MLNWSGFLIFMSIFFLFGRFRSCFHSVSCLYSARHNHYSYFFFIFVYVTLLQTISNGIPEENLYMYHHTDFNKFQLNLMYVVSWPVENSIIIESILFLGCVEICHRLSVIEVFLAFYLTEYEIDYCNCDSVLLSGLIHFFLWRS